jgi:hypothetical protein
MTTELVHSHTSQQVQRTVKVVDGPVVELSWVGKTREVRIAEVTVTYTLRGISGTWKISQVHVSGPVRHNGRETKGVYDDGAPTSWVTAPQWAFLRTITDSLRPLGSAEMPFDSRALED